MKTFHFFKKKIKGRILTYTKYVEIYITLLIKYFVYRMFEKHVFSSCSIVESRDYCIKTGKQCIERQKSQKITILCGICNNFYDFIEVVN